MCTAALQYAVHVFGYIVFLSAFWHSSNKKPNSGLCLAAPQSQLSIRDSPSILPRVNVLTVLIILFLFFVVSCLLLSVIVLRFFTNFMSIDTLIVLIVM